MFGHRFWSNPPPPVLKRGKSALKSLDSQKTPLLHIFKASALWADAFYKSKCPSVRLFTFEVPF